MDQNELMYNNGAVGDQAIDFMDQSSSRMGLKESIDNVNEPQMAASNINFYEAAPETEQSLGKVSNARDIQVKSAKDYLKTNESE